MNQTWVDIECPKCQYMDSIQLIDVKSEKTIFCHNCKVRIELSDGQASVHNAIDSINNSLKELENVFKNFRK